MVLDKEAPLLAQQLRGTLSPDTAPALAGTLLFLIGALYRGKWPGDAVGRALSAAGQDRLRAKLGEDFAELGRLGKDEATGEWQVLTVPLMSGAAVEPLRLYLRRRGAAAETPGDGARFVLEAELSHFGAVQLDGMVRGSRLDLVLRSHAPLPPDLRAEAASVFRRASAAQGFQGDIVFATAATFAVAPLAGLRRPVELRNLTAHGAAAAAVIIDADLVERALLLAREPLALLRRAIGRSNLVALHLAVGLGQVFAGQRHLFLNRRERLLDLLPPLDHLPRVIAIGERRLARGGSDRLLRPLLGRETRLLLAQFLRERVEIGKLPPAFVELPAMQPNEAFERTHGVSPSMAASAA